MRILHLCLASTYADNYAYQENIIPKYHKKDGNEVFIVTSLFTFDSKGKGSYFKEATTYKNEHDIEVTRLNYKHDNKLCRLFRRYSGTYETIEKYSPDVIFIHNVQFMDIKYVVKYLKNHPDVKVYADNHCDYINSASNWVSKNILHKIIWRSCAKKIEPFTTKFYGVLPARVDFLKDIYALPKEKVELLVMGADDEDVKEAKKPEIRKEIREKYGIKDDDFLIISGGKIDSNKPETLNLMRAMSSLPSNIKLMVFGSVVPSLKDEFDKLLANKNIIYIGWVHSTEVYKYFASADLGVFPGLHSVLWEQAIGVGLPCVFRKMKGIDHVDIDGNCVLIDNSDEEALKNCINKIYNDKKVYENMKKVSEEKGMKEFSYQDIARRSIR